MGNSLTFNKDIISVQVITPEKNETNMPLQFSCKYRDDTTTNFIIKKPLLEQEIKPKPTTEQKTVNNQFYEQKQKPIEHIQQSIIQ
ncbi:TPA: hypothetical protein DEG21_03060 [Patescibacteria group bacterium]|nr:hypothetical protein [Candidatus Gracilibacteria bacterium]HBY74845.1 hypothetical protein [Candidatus Gracilibacteria bacterium]